MSEDPNYDYTRHTISVVSKPNGERYAQEVLLYRRNGGEHHGHALRDTHRSVPMSRDEAAIWISTLIGATSQRKRETLISMLCDDPTAPLVRPDEPTGLSRVGAIAPGQSGGEQPLRDKERRCVFCGERHGGETRLVGIRDVHICNRCVLEAADAFNWDCSPKPAAR